MDKKKIKLYIAIFAALLMTFMFSNESFSRYISTTVNNYILESQNFYFNSSLLAINTPTYSVTDWDGVNSYPILIDVNNKKNDLVSTKSNITYDIEVDCPTTVTCTVNKNSGIIDKDVKTDSYYITVTPLQAFTAGQTVTINTTATSNYPYTKAISCNYIVGVTNYGFSYEENDAANQKYVELKLTNSKPFYTVTQAFGDYDVDDSVSVAAYEQLSAADKAKCLGARVTLSWDPHYVLVDSNDTTYMNNFSNVTFQTIDGFTYANGITFEMGATSNEKILFFKVDPSQNYNNGNIVTVSVVN